MRVAILPVLLAIAYPALAQEDQIRYRDIEGIWAPVENIFDRPSDPSVSDCDLINKDLTLTIDGRSIHGKGFSCGIKYARESYQTQVLSYANCSVAGQSILRKYVFSRRGDLLYVALTEIDPGEQEEVLSYSESIYRKARCDSAAQ